MTSDIPSLVSFAVLAILALVAAWWDMRTRTLPNWLVIVTFLAGAGFSMWVGELSDITWHLLHFLAALAIGIGFFALKVWGAGDGKFYAAVAVWFPVQEFLTLVLSISLVGLVCTIAYFFRFKGKLLSRENNSIPYGVAIGFGALLAYSRGIMW